MSKKSLLLLSVVSLLILSLHTSCVDENYDLSKKIDLTISVGGSEFAIPGGMTEEIPLSKILTVEEGDLVKIDPLTGDYFLQQSDVLEKTSFTVSGFNIATPSLSPISTELKFMGDGNASIITTMLPDNTEANLSFTALLPNEVKSVSCLKTDMLLTLTLTLSDATIKALQLKEVAIVLPSGMISNALTDGKYIIKDKQIIAGGKLTVNIPIQRIDLTADDFETNPSGEVRLDYTNKISLQGELSINTADILSGSDVGTANLKTDIKVSHIYATGMKGVVHPSIEKQSSVIYLDNLPDFLSDKNVRLDPLNPMILITANNQSPVVADISGTLTSTYEQSSDNVSVPFSIDDIPATATTDYCVSPINPNLPQTIWIENRDIPSLIHRIPESIAIEVGVNGNDDEIDVDFNKDYYFQSNYEINVPFVFGDKMNFTYTDSISGWHEDIKKYSVKQINAHAIAVNKIPLNLVFKGIAVREDGKGGVTELQGVKVYTKIDGKENGIIKAGEIASASQAKVVVEILETTPGAIKNLDGIVWWVEVDSKEVVDGRLNEHQTFQLKELKLKVPGGMVIDFN